MRAKEDVLWSLHRELNNPNKEYYKEYLHELWLYYPDHYNAMFFGIKEKEENLPIDKEPTSQDQTIVVNRGVDPIDVGLGILGASIIGGFFS